MDIDDKQILKAVRDLSNQQSKVIKQLADQAVKMNEAHARLVVRVEQLESEIKTKQTDPVRGFFDHLRRKK